MIGFLITSSSSLNLVMLFDVSNLNSYNIEFITAIKKANKGIKEKGRLTRTLRIHYLDL